MASKATSTKTTTTKAEGEWTSGPTLFEKAIDDKRTVKSCVATSPDGKQFLSVREWRSKQDGTPYYTRNSVLVPFGDEGMRDAFVAALSGSLSVEAEIVKGAIAKAKKPKKVAA